MNIHSGQEPTDRVYLRENAPLSNGDTDNYLLPGRVLLCLFCKLVELSIISSIKHNQLRGRKLFAHIISGK